MWRYFQISLSIYKVIDFIVDHQDYIRDVVPGFALVIALAMSLWTLIQGQSAPVITTLALVTGTTIFVLFTYIPWWLKTHFPRPFAVVADEMLMGGHQMQISVSVFNQSKTDHIVLAFDVFLKTNDGPEALFHSVDLQDIEVNLGPQQSTRGFVSVNVFKTEYDNVTQLNVWLRVIDRLSGRWIKLEVPGCFPPDFLHLH